MLRKSDAAKLRVTSSDLPWGRREDEDDREWARRCAREAERMIGRKPKTGQKR